MIAELRSFQTFVPRQLVRRREHRVARAVRIGIHIGEALVGNIWAPGRIKYTLVGDSLNVATQLEQLFREIGTVAEAKIMISGDAVARATDKTGLSNAGR